MDWQAPISRSRKSIRLRHHRRNYAEITIITSQDVFSLWLRANNCALASSPFTELSALTVKLVHFHDVPTQWDCPRGQPCTADRLLIYIFISIMVLAHYPPYASLRTHRSQSPIVHCHLLHLDDFPIASTLPPFSPARQKQAAGVSADWELSSLYEFLSCYDNSSIEASFEEIFS